MKTLILFLSLLFPTYVFAGKPDVEFYEKCLYPTVLVRCYAGDKFLGAGTGCIVKSKKVDDHYVNTVLSCAHIIGGDRIKVVRALYTDHSRFDKLVSYDGEKKELDATNDVSILTFFSTAPMPVAEIGWQTPLFIENDVTLIGGGLQSSEPAPHHGRVTSTNHDVGSLVGVLRVSVAAQPGDSGGPIFHEKKIVAIQSSIILWNNFPKVAAPETSLCIPVSKLKKSDLD